MSLHTILGVWIGITCLVGATSAALIDTSDILGSNDWANIDRMVNTAVQCRNVTGLNIAVINNGAVFYRSYGYADYPNRVPLAQETRMSIGSLSKGLLTTLVSILLTENKTRYPLKWSTPLKEIFGNVFQLSDTFRTESATLLDLAAHRMGWTDADIPSVLGRDKSHSRLEYCSRFRYLKANAGFRERYIYNNDGYMLLGCVAEVMTGETFEVVMRRKLLEPLGMNSTVPFFDIHDWNSGRESKLHFNVRTGIVVGPPTILDSLTAILPAGGYCSHIHDMVKWMRFQQTFRTSQGEALADDDILSAMHDNQVAVPSDRSFGLRPQLPLSDQTLGYGLAWYIGSYRGYRNIYHRGILGNAVSQVRVFKDVNLAMAGMANIGGAHAVRTLELTQSYIADLALGVTPWVTESIMCSYPRRVPEPPTWGTRMPPALQGFTPRRDLVVCSADNATPPCQSQNVEQYEIPEWANVYLGNYGHPLWANFTVKFNRFTGYIIGTTGNSFLGRIILHPTYNSTVFLMQARYPVAPLMIPSDPSQLGSPIMFSSVRNGLYTKLTVPMYTDGITPLIFTRGLKWDADVSVAGTHAGDASR